MSHFLYLHQDLSGTPNVWKVGKAITPYSAVRARQKFCWKQFGLDYLYIGVPEDISNLEQWIKDDLKEYSGKHLKGFGTQTELFNIEINKLLRHINNIIVDEELKVKQVLLTEKYTASSSGNCPFGIPSESLAHYWLEDKIIAMFGDQKFTDKKKIRLSRNMFSKLFVSDH